MSITDDLPRAATGLLPGKGTPGVAVPDFVCIGAQKAGTTWLYSMLSQNPSLYLPPVKEIHFFDYVHLPEHGWWIRQMHRRTIARIIAARCDLESYFAGLAALPRTSDNWYRAVFSHPHAVGRITGEITPAYSFLPAEGVRHVRAINPAVRILLVIRDPVDRAMSQLRMAAEKGKRAEISLVALADPKRRASLLARSAYRENIERWEAVFPREQLLYLPYRRIGEDPEGFLRAVEGFIGARPHRYRDPGRSVHRTRPVESRPEVRSELERLFAEERAWLADRFGPDFVA